MAIKLNQKAVDYAMDRIKSDEVDHLNAPWSAHKATEDEKDKFIQNHYAQEYGLWFLGENDEEKNGGQEKYAYPTGDLKLIHLTALEETEKEARANGHADIAQAARKLLEFAKKNSKNVH